MLELSKFAPLGPAGDFANVKPGERFRAFLHYCDGHVNADSCEVCVKGEPEYNNRPGGMAAIVETGGKIPWLQEYPFAVYIVKIAQWAIDHPKVTIGPFNHIRYLLWLFLEQQATGFYYRIKFDAKPAELIRNLEASVIVNPDNSTEVWARDSAFEDEILDQLKQVEKPKNPEDYAIVIAATFEELGGQLSIDYSIEPLDIYLQIGQEKDRASWQQSPDAFRRTHHNRLHYSATNGWWPLAYSYEYGLATGLFHDLSAYSQKELLKQLGISELGDWPYLDTLGKVDREDYYKLLQELDEWEKRLRQNHRHPPE